MLVTAVLLLAVTTTVQAQHTRSEFGASFAYGGQYPFIADGNANFFALPTIWNLRAQLGTNFVQSYSVIFERIGQSSIRQGLWSPRGSVVDPTSAYNANIDEHLAMYAIYFETNRTVIRTDNFRLGVGLALGYALGSADASVENIVDNSTRTYDGDAPWSSFYLSIFTRGRLTLYETEQIDVGLTGTIRYWGLPTLGPVAVSMSNYNGPNIRTLHELGYLAGVSVGIKKWK
jgi:hypothetical protein